MTYPPARPPLPLAAGPSYLSRSPSPARAEPRPHVSFNLPANGRSQARTPSPAPLARSRLSALPTPPPSRPASIPPTTFSVFFDPSRPPPVLNLKEGETLSSSNICRYRNKIRSPMAFWEQGLAYRMQQSLWEMERLLKERFPGPRDLYDARGTNALWIEACYEPALACLRMMEGTYEYFVVSMSGLSTVRPQADAVQLDRKRPRSRMVISNYPCVTGAGVSEYSKDTSRTSFLFSRRPWRRPPTSASISPQQELLSKVRGLLSLLALTTLTELVSTVDDLLKQHADAMSAQRRLEAAWRAEYAAPHSALLRKQVDQVMDRSSWYQLQWRAITLEEGAEKNKVARILLGKEVERTLNALRRCVGRP